MNKARKQHIEAVINRIGELQAELEGIRDEEQNAYDNMPESIQESERGEKMCQNIDDLEYAFSALEEAAEYLNDVAQR